MAMTISSIMSLLFSQCFSNGTAKQVELTGLH